MQDLIWHRNRFTGEWSTERVGTTEFRATAARTARGWYLSTFTFGLGLTGSEHRTMQGVRAEADSTYRNVEGAATGVTG